MHEECCPICYELLHNDDNTVFTTRCNHQFHRKCINRSLKYSTACPLCRCVIPCMDTENNTKHLVSTYLRCCNDMGYRWTIGLDKNGVVISSFPIWISAK